MAALSAAEALVYVSARVDMEGWCALRVEGAKPDPSRAAAPQLHEVFHDIVNLLRIENRVYRFLRNHGLK